MRLSAGQARPDQRTRDGGRDERARRQEARAELPRPEMQGRVGRELVLDAELTHRQRRAAGRCTGVDYRHSYTSASTSIARPGPGGKQEADAA
jgi:hypothetical protein